MVWHARVEAHLARQRGDVVLKQKEYFDVWKALSVNDWAAWQEERRQSAAPVSSGTIEAVPDVEQPCEPFIVIDSEYTVASLVQEYASISETHAVRLKHAEARYVMYGKIALMLQRKDWTSQKACLEDKALVTLHVQRQKLQLVRGLLDAAGHLLCLCPPAFRSGRGQESQLSEEEKQELLDYICFHARHAQACSVEDVKRALCLLKLEKFGLLRGVTDCTSAEQRLDAYFESYDLDGAWRRFKEWVRSNKSAEDWLCVKNLKAKPIQDISMCTEKVISRALQNLESLLKQCEIMNSDGIVLESHSEQLVCCDEKGFSQRSDSIRKGVVPRSQMSTACGLAPEITWDHITVTSFMPLSGRRYPSGVVVSTKVTPHPRQCLKMLSVPTLVAVQTRSCSRSSHWNA